MPRCRHRGTRAPRRRCCAARAHAAIRRRTPRGAGGNSTGICRRRTRRNGGTARAPLNARSTMSAASMRAICAAAARGDLARRDLRAHQCAHPRGRPVCSGRLCALAIHRHHAGGTGRARAVSGEADVHRAQSLGGANPAVLVAARKAGVDQIFKVGGAQAIAAMAYGSEPSRSATRSLGRAMPTSPPRKYWRRKTPAERRSTFRPA